MFLNIIAAILLLDQEVIRGRLVQILLRALVEALSRLLLLQVLVRFKKRTDLAT